MERGGDEDIKLAVPSPTTIEVLVSGVVKVKTGLRVSCQKLSEECRPGGMVEVGVCIPSDIDGNVGVSSSGVLHDEGDGGHSYQPLMLLSSGRQVESNVDRWRLPRDVQ